MNDKITKCIDSKILDTRNTLCKEYNYYCLNINTRRYINEKLMKLNIKGIPKLYLRIIFSDKALIKKSKDSKMSLLTYKLYKFFEFNGKIKVTIRSKTQYSVGQPMGFYSSWASMSISHHMLV